MFFNTWKITIYYMRRQVWTQIERMKIKYLGAIDVGKKFRDKVNVN